MKRLKSWSPRRPGRSGNRKSALVLSQSMMNKISSASYFDTSRLVVGNECASSLAINIRGEGVHFPDVTGVLLITALRIVNNRVAYC